MATQKLARIEIAINDDIAIITNPESGTYDIDHAKWRLGTAGNILIKTIQRMCAKGEALTIAGEPAGKLNMILNEVQAMSTLVKRIQATLETA